MAALESGLRGFREMKLVLVAVAGLSAGSVALGGAITTDFSAFANGDNVEGVTFNAGSFAEFIGTSTGDNDGLYIFDTSPGGPNDGGPDDDLIVPGFGNALILQDSDSAPPNDANEGGVITFAFTNAVGLTSIDLIDFNGSSASTFTLTDTEGDIREFSIPNDWTGEPGVNGADGFGTLLFDTNNQVGFDGNIASFTDTGMFDLSSVVSIEFDLGGSAALDNLVIVPAPGAAALLLAGFGAARRRRG